MIRQLLKAIFVASIVTLIGGCKPARFVYVVGNTSEAKGNDPLYPDQVSGFDITATTGALTTITGSPWAADLGPVEGVAVTPSGEFLYVTNFDSGNISGYSINTSTGALTPIAGSPFATPGSSPPVGAAVDSSSKFLYVALASSPPNAVAGFTIDSTTGALTPIAGSPFATGFSFPWAVAISGNFLYVTNNDSNNVSVFAINASTGALTEISGSPFPAGNLPQSIAVDPVGGYLYVANAEDNTVSAYGINASTGTLTSVPGSPFKVGTGPSSVAVGIEVSLAGNSIGVASFVYVANEGDNDVSGFSVGSNGALTAIEGSPFMVGPDPDSVTVDPSGQFAYVANYFSKNVSGFTVDATTGALTPIAGSPWSVSDFPYAVITTAGP